MVHSYPFLVSFFQIGKLSLSLGVLDLAIHWRSYYNAQVDSLGRVIKDLGGVDLHCCPA